MSGKNSDVEIDNNAESASSKLESVGPETSRKVHADDEANGCDDEPNDDLRLPEPRKIRPRKVRRILDELNDEVLIPDPEPYEMAKGRRRSGSRKRRRTRSRSKSKRRKSHRRH